MRNSKITQYSSTLVSLPNLAILMGSALFCANTVQADVAIDYDSSDQGMRRLAIHDGKLRVDTDDDSWLLFNSGEDAMYFIDDQEQSYTVFNQATIEKLGATMNRAKAELDAAMAELPPAQREQMRKMMGDAMSQMLGEKKSIEISVQETNRTDTVAGVQCRIVEAHRNGQRFHQVCLAAAKELGADRADSRVFGEWTEFTQTMMEAVAEQSQGLIPFEAPSFHSVGSGLPILSIDEDGQRQQMIKHSNQALDGSAFTIPSHYKEERIETDF